MSTADGSSRAAKVVAAIVLIALAVFGVLDVIHKIADILAGIRLDHFSLGHFPSWAFKNFDHVNGMATAMATVALAISTFALVKATDRLGAADAPFLCLELLPPGPLLAGGAAYDPIWEKEDLEHAELAPYLHGVQSQYVHLRVLNQQHRPYGIAGDVSILVELNFPGRYKKDKISYSRIVKIPVVGAEEFRLGPLFNVGNLSEYQVVICGVKYADITGRCSRRRAAYGSGELQFSAGVASIKPRIFKPVRGEFAR